MIASGLACAVGGGDAPWTRKARPALERLARQAVLEPSGLVDDRGMLHVGIYQVRKLAGDDEGARKAAAEWLDSIEAEDRAAPHPSPDERASRDGCRLQAATFLGQAARAVPALEASARLAPDDYSTHRRLASAYEGAGRHDEALASAARGLSLSPGPEGRARLLMVRGAAQARKGDRAAASKTFDEAVAALSRILNQATRQALLRRIEELRRR